MAIVNNPSDVVSSVVQHGQGQALMLIKDQLNLRMVSSLSSGAGEVW